MTRIAFRSFSYAVAILAVWTPAIAQVPEPRVLDTVQVRQLVARGQVDDHLRLSAHFDALHGAYASDAFRHAAMATLPPFAKGAEVASAQHCRLLAREKGQEATIVQQLAAHHARLADGIPSDAPSGAAPYEAGKGALAPRPDSLSVAAATAFTQTDHAVIVDHYARLAERYSAESVEHAATAQAWRRLTAKVPSAAATAERCNRIAEELRQLAIDAGATASEHRALAESFR